MEWWGVVGGWIGGKCLSRWVEHADVRDAVMNAISPRNSSAYHIPTFTAEDSLSLDSHV